MARPGWSVTRSWMSIDNYRLLSDRRYAKQFWMTQVTRDQVGAGIFRALQCFCPHLFLCLCRGWPAELHRWRAHDHVLGTGALGFVLLTSPACHGQSYSDLAGQSQRSEEEFAARRRQLVEALKSQGLKQRPVLDALLKVPR